MHPDNTKKSASLPDSVALNTLLCPWARAFAQNRDVNTHTTHVAGICMEHTADWIFTIGLCTTGMLKPQHKLHLQQEWSLRSGFWYISISTHIQGLQVFQPGVCHRKANAGWEA